MQSQSLRTTKLCVNKIVITGSRILLRQLILKMSKQGQWFSAHEPRIFDILRVFFARGSLAG